MTMTKVRPTQTRSGARTLTAIVTAAAWMAPTAAEADPMASEAAPTVSAGRIAPTAADPAPPRPADLVP